MNAQLQDVNSKLASQQALINQYKYSQQSSLSTSNPSFTDNSSKVPSKEVAVQTIPQRSKDGTSPGFFQGAFDLSTIPGSPLVIHSTPIENVQKGNHQRRVQDFDSLKRTTQSPEVMRDRGEQMDTILSSRKSLERLDKSFAQVRYRCSFYSCCFYGIL